jgi:TRAP-type uncharacterized transport system fused permease subunit
LASTISTWLLAIRHHTHRVADLVAEPLTWRDRVNLGAFVVVLGGLVGLMATIHLAPMFAALYMFCFAGLGLFVIYLVPLLGPGRWSWRRFFEPLHRFLDSYIDMITDIALLLATLSIMTGALVITGVPTKLGSLLVEAAGINMIAMVLMAFLFGAILGTGLPPAPVYILVAIVIAPPMMKIGINPWVVHFFAFFVAVFGELTPPTSVTAAITSKIANASFYTTLWRSVQICVSLFTLMAGVFVHPEIVAEPGLAQLGAALLVAIATLGITFSLQGRFSDRRVVDRVVRIVLAAFALVVLLDPDYTTATAAAVPVVAAIAYWLVRRRNVSPEEPEAVGLDSSKLAPSPAGSGPLGRMS